MRTRGQRDRREQRPRRAAPSWLIALLACACAAAPEAARITPTAAIERRGGPLESFTRRSELVVHYGFPGHWQWELSFRRPDRFRLVLDTTGEPQTFASDGTTSRTWHGSALLAQAPAAGSCERSLARWLALASLDGLSEPGVRWWQLPEREAPRTLRADCASDRAEFLLRFDPTLRLVEFSGPVRIPALGSGRLAAHFHDFRRVDHYLLPFAIDYTLDGERFAEERVWEIVPDDPRLAGDAFERPPAR